MTTTGVMLEGHGRAGADIAAPDISQATRIRRTVRGYRVTPLCSLKLGDTLHGMAVVMRLQRLPAVVTTIRDRL